MIKSLRKLNSPHRSCWRGAQIPASTIVPMTIIMFSFSDCQSTIKFWITPLKSGSKTDHTNIHVVEQASSKSLWELLMHQAQIILYLVSTKAKYDVPHITFLLYSYNQCWNEWGCSWNVTAKNNSKVPPVSKNIIHLFLQINSLTIRSE